jgi:peroxiredoxin Q/BCP
MLQTGQKAPEFDLPDHDGESVALSDFAGKWLVLYFYPKAMTPGCTSEACTFQEWYDEFTDRNVAIVGVSTDPVENLHKFVAAEGLDFILLSDEEGTVAAKYDSFGKREHEGDVWEIAYRNTYLIGPDGYISRKYEDVSPETHPAEVLADIQELQS